MQNGFLSNLAKSVLVLGALAVPTFGAADNYNPCPPTDCCDWNAPCHEAPCLGQGYNPSAYFDCGANTCFTDNLSLRVDFLWWRAGACDTVLGWEEGINTGAASTNGAAAFQSLSRVDAKPHFDPGVRVGIGYVCPCDGWDLQLIWTDFHTQGSARAGSVIAGDASVFFRPAWESVTDSIPDFARGKWKLELDLLDLELGHKYFVSRCFALRPFIGLRGGRINQNFKYEAFANRTSNIGSSDTFNSYVSAKNNFLGAGPRIGLDIEFDLGCNFVLYGQAAGSVLYGRFENHSNEYYNDFSTVASSAAPYRFNQHAPSDRSSGGVTDIAIGLRWEHCLCLCGGQHPISLAVAWEHHGFYGFSGFDRSTDTIDYATNGVTTPVTPSSSSVGPRHECRDDFFVQGLTVTATFGF